MIVSLKRLLEKWTSAVANTANSNGKYKLKTGSKIVPRPKPLKKVAKDPIKQTSTIPISPVILIIFVKNNMND